MRKLSVLMVLMISVLLGGNAWAASCIQGLPAGTITVAKSNGNFTTIQNAINCATGTGGYTNPSPASATNPYIIRVMPGIYNESITMKPYVDVVGSGQENTKITSTAAATVTGANNSTIENIWVDSTNATSPNLIVSSILNDNTTMTVNKVKVTMNVPTGTSEACGIRNTGNDASITNSLILSTNTIGARSTLGICALANNVTISNCKINVDSSGGPSHLWNAGIWAKGTAEVRDSIINVAGARYNYGVEVGGGGSQISITNSTITATSTTNTTNENVAFMGSGHTVANSKIIADGNGNVLNTINHGTSKFGSSMIQGTIDYGYPVKLVNCWDGDFNPITNQ